MRLALAALLVAAPAFAADPLRVVTTIEPLCMLAREIGGDAVACSTLVPPGASPHAFEPRPSAMAAVARAELLLRAGNGIDDWAEPLGYAGSERWVVLGPACARGDSACAHFWLDPRRAGAAISRAARAMLERDRTHEVLWSANAAQLRIRLLRDPPPAFADLRGASFVSFHPAWGGFAEAFGLRDLGAIQAHGAEEPTPHRLAELIARARAASARLVLVEPQLDPHTARIVAEELGARVVTVDPLGDPRDPERASYTALLAWNARQLAAALAEEAR